MTVQLAPVLEVFQREETTPGQCSIQQRRGMPLAEDEPVAVRPVGILGINTQAREEQRRHDLGGRERAARMTGSAAVDHFQAVDPQLARSCLPIRSIGLQKDKTHNLLGLSVQPESPFTGITVY